MYFNAGATDISSNNEMSDAEQDLVVQAIFEDNSSATRYAFQNDDTSGSSGARVAHHNGGGMYESTEDIDGLKIFQSSGNLSGTVKLYGLKGS